jgi:hypothetical protein
MLTSCMLEKVAFAKMVNRGDALQSEEWRHEPCVKLASAVIEAEGHDFGGYLTGLTSSGHGSYQ